jgi:putative oxidoreductase
MADHLFAQSAGVGVLILRLGLGITFFPHGWEKIKNPAGFAGFLRQIRVPAPSINAWVVGLLESLGAVLLILGIATRLIGLGLAIDMLVALLTVRIGKAPFASGGKGAGWDFEFILLMASLALAFTGAGPLGLDHYLGW